MTKTEVQKHVDQVLAEMQGIEITTQDHYEQAADFLRRTKETTKIVKEHFEPERKRTHEAYKAVTETIKNYTDRLNRAERTVKNAMSKYVTEQEKKRREIENQRRREEEESRLQHAIATNDETIINEPIKIKREPEPPKPRGTYTVDVWDYVIIDARRINPEYLIPDTKSIGALVRSKKAAAQNILGPGVEVTQRTEVRQRI